MIDGRRLDGGYGVTGTPVIMGLLKELSPDERKEYIKELKKENLKAFNQFYESYSKRLKKLGIEI